jgi:outer membrane protein TolC
MVRGFESLSLRLNKSPYVRGFYYNDLRLTSATMDIRKIFLRAVFTILLFVLLLPVQVFAQDTLRLTIHEFIERGLRESTMLKARQQSVEIAGTRIQEAKASRIVPNASANTAHGLVPGVKGTQGNPPGSLYLDPTLRNDWEDWAVFTRAEITAIQPIYTWGAISNAIKAAESGAKAAEAAFDGEISQYETSLWELYYAKLLALELSRLVDRANSEFLRADRELEKLLDEGDDSIEDKDIYEFNIFRHEFDMMADEVNENLMTVNRIWNLALNNDDDIVFLPEEQFLDVLEISIGDIGYYEQRAIVSSPEMRQINAVVVAAQHGLQVARAQNYPSFFLGISASVAVTPNRPKQDNPFIQNRTNFSNLVYGFGFRQNLNFGIMKSRQERSRIQFRQATYTKEAVTDALRLDLAERYKNVMVARSRIDHLGKAYDVSNEWLRQEQLDYDLGFGDVKNLVDAVKKNLELEVALKQRTHDFNVSIGRLYRAAGIPFNELPE